MEIKLINIIEALLFVADKPLSINQLKQITDKEKKDLASCLDELIAEYDVRNSGLQLIKIAGGYQLCTRPEVAPWIKRFYTSRQLLRLSQPALETLAIVAYRQPIIRAEIEAVRGVDVSGILRMLLEKSLIRIVGRKKVPGRPIMYGTTQEFLLHFGLEDLSSLPKLEELQELLPPDEVVADIDCNPEDTNEG